MQRNKEYQDEEYDSEWFFVSEQLSLRLPHMFGLPSETIPDQWRAINLEIVDLHHRTERLALAVNSFWACGFCPCGSFLSQVPLLTFCRLAGQFTSLLPSVTSTDASERYALRGKEARVLRHCGADSRDCPCTSQATLSTTNLRVDKLGLFSANPKPLNQTEPFPHRTAHSNKSCSSLQPSNDVDAGNLDQRTLGGVATVFHSATPPIHSRSAQRTSRKTGACIVARTT